MLTDEQRAQLDALVPAPWPTWRRRLAAGGLLLALLVVIGGVRAGVVGPQLSVGYAGGSVDMADPARLVAEYRITVRNRGWVAATVAAFEPADVDGVAWRRVRGLPVTLGPGEEHVVAIGLEVAGCEIHAGGHDVVGLRASGGLAPPRVIDVPADTPLDPTMRTTYRVGNDEGDLVRPAWPDQPPSWILDAIEPACTAPPDDRV